MKSKTKFKAKKKKINVLRLALVGVVALVVVYFVMSAVKIVNLNKERAEIEEQNKELKETVEDLNQQLEIINTDKYMEGLARKRLKLVHSNEILFVLPDLRVNENDETVAPTDMAMEEAQRLVDEKEAKDEADKAKEEKSKDTSKDKDSKDKDKEEDNNG
ncbi:MAG: septum formation initiator family protein [Clostridiales bacterium]|nr:septum formation initiator family protein [Clostridiales bacterium]